MTLDSMGDIEGKSTENKDSIKENSIVLKPVDDSVHLSAGVRGSKWESKPRHFKDFVTYMCAKNSNVDDRLTIKEAY